MIFFALDVCANHTCVNGDCLATSSKTWECRCYNGWKGQNCDIGMFISKTHVHVVIGTEIFTKTQILHLKKSKKKRVLKLLNKYIF